MGRLLQHIFNIWSTKGGSFEPARRRLLLSLLVAVVGVGLSVSFYLMMRTRELEVAEQQFLHSGEWRAEVLQREMIEQLHAVTTLEAFFAGSDPVDRKEFRRFAESIHAGRKGILAVGWMPRIQDSQRRSHERFVRDEGLSKYKIAERTRSGKFIPAGTRAEYYPIAYIEPNEKWKSLLGFDIQSLPECRAAIRRAASSKRPAAGLCSPLNDESADHVLLFVVAPASNVSAHPGNRSADQSGGDGFVFALFEIDVTAKSALHPLAA
jgi:CHASE1-domain containing sensor protein